MLALLKLDQTPHGAEIFSHEVLTDEIRPKLFRQVLQKRLGLLRLSVHRYLGLLTKVVSLGCVPCAWMAFSEKRGCSLGLNIDWLSNIDFELLHWDSFGFRMGECSWALEFINHISLSSGVKYCFSILATRESYTLWCVTGSFRIMVHGCMQIEFMLWTVVAETRWW